MMKQGKGIKANKVIQYVTTVSTGTLTTTTTKKNLEITPQFITNGTGGRCNPGTKFIKENNSTIVTIYGVECSFSFSITHRK
eukprot:m.11713 g.11713  ORF g.11713 m.11713 type:complete len:82 (+) comp3878_c0_seq1:265-510(+)